MEEKDEIIISPKMIFEVLRKNLVFIIITVLVFSLGSFFVTNFLVGLFAEYAELCSEAG